MCVLEKVCNQFQHQHLVLPNPVSPASASWLLLLPLLEIQLQ
jgi:hypothetical protein